MRVALRVIPLQLASWLVVPLPWTLPRMVVLQMAQPLAVVEGAGRDEALAASREMMAPIVWQYAGVGDVVMTTELHRCVSTVPYLGTIVLLKTLEPLRQLLFDLMPPRWYRELPEIPLLMVVGFALGGAVLARLKDVLPYSMYKLERDVQ